MTVFIVEAYFSFSFHTLAGYLCLVNMDVKRRLVVGCGGFAAY